MRPLLAATVLIAASCAAPALAQSTPDPALTPSTPDPALAAPAQTKPNISATGRTMPPVQPREPGTPRPSTEADMLKAQKAAETRNKAWDARMRKTMGSICTGC